jgi:hypothetical protein
MSRSLIWMSYDLGVRGDYEGLYRWLDKHDANECGDSVASFWYEYSRIDPRSELKAELEESVEIDKKARIYIIWKDRNDNDTTKGRFIFGGRRAAPWAGYAEADTGTADTEE